MPSRTHDGDPRLSPDDAFAALGSEVRIEILQTLGDADEPLSFSELRDSVGVRDAGRFSYHLDKLKGHFVSKESGMYSLRQAGRRVIEAVYSGAVTRAPTTDRTEIDMACPYCEASTEVRFIEERVEAFCTACEGTYGYSALEDESVQKGFLGSVLLPPAGIYGRSATEIARAGATWGNLQLLVRASGLCPRCSAPLDISTSVCQDHERSGGLCDRCNQYYAVGHEEHCTNCIFSTAGAIGPALRANADLLAFQLENGLNPVDPDDITDFLKMMVGYDEEVLSTEPLLAEITFSLDDDSITLTVDDARNVVSVTEHRP